MRMKETGKGSRSSIQKAMVPRTRAKLRRCREANTREKEKPQMGSTLGAVQRS